MQRISLPKRTPLFKDYIAAAQACTVLIIFQKLLQPAWIWGAEKSLPFPKLRMRTEATLADLLSSWAKITLNRNILGVFMCSLTHCIKFLITINWWMVILWFLVIINQLRWGAGLVWRQLLRNLLGDAAVAVIFMLKVPSIGVETMMRCLMTIFLRYWQQSNQYLIIQLKGLLI